MPTNRVSRATRRRTSGRITAYGHSSALSARQQHYGPSERLATSSMAVSV
jgi:hypothetical protein